MAYSIKKFFLIRLSPILSTFSLLKVDSGKPSIFSLHLLFGLLSVMLWFLPRVVPLLWADPLRLSTLEWEILLVMLGSAASFIRVQTVDLPGDLR
jgi:hypothetical protein